MYEQEITIDLNPRERRVYDRLRAKVVRNTRAEHSSLFDYLLFLPDLTMLLWRLLRDPRVPFGGKAIALFGVGYVLSPIDLLPALLFGPFGILDDLLVVTAALSRILNYVHPDVVRSHWSGKIDALDLIFRVTRWAEEFFGEKFRSVTQLVRRAAR